MLKWLMLAVFFVFPMVGNAQAIDGQELLAKNEPNLRVGILTNQQSILISSDANFAIINSGTAEVLESFRAYDGVAISAKDSGFIINGKPVSAAGLTVIQKKEDLIFFVEQRIYVNKRRYRGDISIHHTAGKAGMTVVNTLPVEQYLYGVIKNEISPEWPMEAVKAQAVAARTYALTNYNKHKADGFDVCASTDCQVYGGRESEAPRALEAVDATRGLVVTYNGNLITAYFHSSSGGYTENSENVWSSFQPYIRGVADFDQNSPYFKWEKKLSIEKFNQLIRNAGYNIGSLQAIELSPLTAPPVVSPDRGVSGRVKMLELQGTASRVQLSGTKLRTILDLKSTLFDISVVTNVHQKLALPLYTHTVKGEVQPKVTNSLIVKDNSNDHPVDGESDVFIVITGYGWGHGLGLSQWGAKAMAEKEQSGNAEYFRDILKHYYQGVEIKKAYL